MSKTYYFVEMDQIDIPIEGFSTSQQMTLEGTKKDADPISTLNIINKDYYRGWMHLQALHETIDKTPRRMAGDPEYLHHSIVGGDRPFDCYYNEKDKMIIMNTSKMNVIGLQRRLIQNFPELFKPHQRELDFKHLLQQLRHTQIVSSWFNNIQGKVNAVGLFGQRVNLDEIFNHYNQIGNLSAITVEWVLKNEEQPMNVMFTKNFGVVLYSNWAVDKDLDFLFELKNLLFKKEIINS
ncbi:hypothetical protein D3H55_22825 [Bacillus salacetis]|uniref:Uncharacterized protein n=1 Tax=Bacillus salacetis TaxID=2315464 RepID=A0A3A1QPC8_9BACI|nr:hypothetical protein [Bacillus salacetis]RIW27626.1 hypothetical protein D3H55_22825 [Bacillus salacetis]